MTHTIGRHAVIELKGPGRLTAVGPTTPRPRLQVAGPDGSVIRIPTFGTTTGAVAARFSSGVIGRNALRWLDAAGAPVADAEAIEVVDDAGAEASDRVGPIQVAADGTHFEHPDGTPFLWLADTWWHALSSRITDENLHELTVRRVSQGFTAVQLVVGPLPEVREWEPRGETIGGYAWERGWTQLRPAFFEAADRRIQRMLADGLLPVIVGAWGYHLADAGVDVMREHWTELVARYAAYPVVWVVAGEASMPWYDLFEEPDVASHEQRLVDGWTDVTKHIRSIDPFRRPLTIHPSGSTRVSVATIPDLSLTDFQMLQTGHWDRGSLPGTMDTLAGAVALEPRQPVINGEVCYEGIMGASWPDLQRFLWWAQVLAGAGGHTYGAQGLWGVNDGSFTGEVGSWGDATWSEAASLPGAAHVGAARRWLDERPWAGMRPANEAVSLGATPGQWLRPYAARLPDGRLVAYFPSAALLDNGEADVRAYHQVVFGGFPAGAMVRLAYHDPRTFALRLQEECDADASGNASITRGVLSALPSMDDWVVEATVVT